MVNGGGGKSESLVGSMLSLSSMKNVLYSHSYIIHYISLPSHKKSKIFETFHVSFLVIFHSTVLGFLGLFEYTSDTKM